MHSPSGRALCVKTLTTILAWHTQIITLLYKYGVQRITGYSVRCAALWPTEDRVLPKYEAIKLIYLSFSDFILSNNYFTSYWSSAVIWLTYCRYGVKRYTINQSILLIPLSICIKIYREYCNTDMEVKVIFFSSFWKFWNFAISYFSHKMYAHVCRHLTWVRVSKENLNLSMDIIPFTFVPVEESGRIIRTRFGRDAGI